MCKKSKQFIYLNVLRRSREDQLDKGKFCRNFVDCFVLPFEGRGSVLVRAPDS